MRISDLFGHTLRSAPPNASSYSEKLLARAGYIHPVSPGEVTFLPLGRKLLRKLEATLIHEFNMAGGQEIYTPVAPIVPVNENPIPSASPFSEKHPYIFENPIIMQHHAINRLIDSLSKNNQTMKQEGFNFLYRFNVSSNSTLRKNYGDKSPSPELLLECSIVSNDQENDELLINVFRRINNSIAKLCNISISESDSLHTNSSENYREVNFFCQDDEADLSVYYCESCGFLVTDSQARSEKVIPPQETQHNLIPQYTPGCEKIDILASFLNIPKSKILKSLFLIAEINEGQAVDEFLIIALLRGDMSISYHKLSNAINATRLRFASKDELSALGLIPGYSSPIGISFESTTSRYRNKILIIADDILPSCPNLVGGGNAVESHFINANYLRDFRADLLTDIVSMGSNPLCPRCKGVLCKKSTREIGFVSSRIGNPSRNTSIPSVQDNQINHGLKKSHGWYNLNQILYAVVANNSDEFGLKLPHKLAPFDIYLILLDSSKTLPLRDHANQLYETLVNVGFDVLFDDRDIRSGEKFFDADLIGLPIRLTVSERSFSQGGVELKYRNNVEKAILPFESVVTYVQTSYNSLS